MALSEGRRAAPDAVASVPYFDTDIDDLAGLGPQLWQ